ncbi:hypothetical protein OEZ86_005008 [Tetradesmus obliquus]|nr:hypothetical protein OEZ86_005008 [Tetradesmus obliquus]
MSKFSGRLLAAALACCTLLLLVGTRPTAGQGLSATNEQLGANAQATATEFDTFEDLMALSTTGGRGRGSRGSSGNLGSSFREGKEFEQLQTATYYVGGSLQIYNSFDKLQTPGGLDYVPKAREQGSCNSCVGQAVAAAVQMSLAYTTRQPVDNFDVSAGALYYCLSGGRTCKTGWDIPAALRALETNPQWMVPGKCFEAAQKKNSAGAAESDISDFQGICLGTTSKSEDPVCSGIKKDQPRYSCSFKSLSSFWQVQQHIRTHGAAVTRIAVYDDFNVQFNRSAKDNTSMELPPYRRNTTAKLQYGHAALIVGYDNTDFTWTVLNSWGNGTTPSNPRKTGGITKDGMFRIRMGVAGVGTPDLTYGVVCEPAPGSVGNMHANKPWLRNTRLPLTPAKDEPRENRCYFYTMTAKDTFASVADHFEVELSDLVQNNLKLFSVVHNTTYKYQTTLSLDEMKDTLRTIQNVTQRMLGTPDNPKLKAGDGAMEPYFVCTHYEAPSPVILDPPAPGKPGIQVRCDMATLDADPTGLVTNCTRNGTVGCSLFYSDVNVTTPAPGSRIRLCNSAWGNSTTDFNDVAKEVGTGTNRVIPETQEVALRSVLKAIDSNLTDAEASSYINCSDVEQNSNWAMRRTNTTSSGVRFSLAIGCTGRGNVIGLYFRVLSKSSKVSPQMHPNLDEKLVWALLDLPQLSWLYIYVYAGKAAPQLGALKLTDVRINHYCMDGSLPPNLLYGWPGLRVLAITRQGDALDYTDSAIGSCGISGPIPQQWKYPPRRDVNTTVARLPNGLSYIDLSGNMLTGSLPAIIGGIGFNRNLRYMYLQRNKFTGRVPDAWSKLRPLDENGNATSVDTIDVHNNQLEGPLPVSLNRLEGRLGYLYMDGNKQLSGCVPLTPFTTVSFTDTQVTGRCAGSSNQGDMHQRQKIAITKHLMPALGVNVEPEFSSMLLAVVSEITTTLGESVQSGQVSKTFQENHPQGEQRGYCKIFVSLIDGIEYITDIEVGADDEYPAGGLDMQHLQDLLRELQQLRLFECSNCNSASASFIQLPDTLPDSAPNLTTLSLSGCGLVGTIPSTYGNWTQMVSLNLLVNNLTGSLPGELAKLQKLTMLDLRRNQLSGTLPSEWSALPKELYLGLDQNTNITGSIPAAFVSNKGTYYSLYNTSISGCVPSGLLGVFETWQQLLNKTFTTQTLPTCK